MARHRSPEGRRALIGLPLSATPSAAGAGGEAFQMPVFEMPVFSASRPDGPPAYGRYPAPLAPDAPAVGLSVGLPSAGLTTLAGLTSSMPVRMVATVVAGSALAATGQMALANAAPLAADGATALRTGMSQLFTPADAAAQLAVAPTGAAPLLVAPVAAVSPVVAEPAVADASSLVRAAELQRQAAEAAEAARVAEEARVAEAARQAEVQRVAAEAEAAVSSAGGGIQMIVGRITSGFGARWGTSHQGLDIAAPIGTPIRVPLAGTVIDSGPASGFGMWVRVRHDDGTITVYGHINRSLVSVGQDVSAGEEIAEVGNRGQSTGPHLHFEVITPGGTKVNPRPWLDERGIGLT